MSIYILIGCLSLYMYITAPHQPLCQYLRADWPRLSSLSLGSHAASNGARVCPSLLICSHKRRGGKSLHTLSRLKQITCSYI